MFLFQLASASRRIPEVSWTIARVKEEVGHGCTENIARAIIKTAKTPQAISEKIKAVRSALQNGVALPKYPHPNTAAEIEVLRGMREKGSKNAMLCLDTYDLARAFVQSPAEFSSKVGSIVSAIFAGESELSERQWDTYHSLAKLESILSGDIVSGKNFELQLLDVLLLIPDKHIGWDMLLTHLENIFYNPKFNAEMLAMLKRISPLLTTNADVAFWFLDELFRKPGFNKTMLGPLEYLVTQSADQASYSIRFLHRLFDNPSFKPGMFTLDLAKRLSETVKAIAANAGKVGLHIAGVFSSIVMAGPALRPEMLGEQLGTDFGKLFKLVLEKQPAASISLERMLAYNEDFLQNLGAILSYYGRAKELASDKNNVELCLNMAYALATIGEERAKELNSYFGIEYFARYSAETLEILHANIHPRHQAEKPLLLAVFNKNDGNGAFYSEGQELEQLTKYYRLLVVEVDTEDKFYGFIADIPASYGRISALIIGGHGKPEEVLMGADTEKGKIDLTDISELETVRASFIANLIVILVSCSTGSNPKSLSAMLSKAWNARSFAPRIPSSKTHYHLLKSGKISTVSYSEFDYQGAPNIGTEYLKGVPIRQ